MRRKLRVGLGKRLVARRPAPEDGTERLLDPAAPDDQRVGDVIPVGDLDPVPCGDGEWMTGGRGRLGERRLPGLVEADRERELGLGPVRVLEADRGAVRPDRRRSRPDQRLERSVEVGATRQRLGTGGERGHGVGSPGSVVGHVHLLDGCATGRTAPRSARAASYTARPGASSRARRRGKRPVRGEAWSDRGRRLYSAA